MPSRIKALPPAEPNENQIRVLLVEDHSAMRDGLYSMLSRQADMVVVGEAADGHEAIAQVEKTRPDVVLLYINLSFRNHLDNKGRLYPAASTNPKYQ